MHLRVRLGSVPAGSESELGGQEHLADLAKLAVRLRQIESSLTNLPSTTSGTKRCFLSDRN